MSSISQVASAAFSRARWALLVVLTALVSTAFLPVNMVTVEECVTVPKGAGWLGVHFALLRESSACSTGSYAVGGETGTVLGIVLMVAVPILLINLAAMVLAVGFGGMVKSALQLVRAVLGAVFPQLLQPVVHIVRRVLRVDREPLSLSPQRYISPASGRGPPIFAVV